MSKEKKETTENIALSVRLPGGLYEQILREAEKEKRSRHSQIIYALEKFFEKATGNGKREKSK